MSTEKEEIRLLNAIKQSDSHQCVVVVPDQGSDIVVKIDNKSWCPNGNVKLRALIATLVDERLLVAIASLPNNGALYEVTPSGRKIAPNS